MTVLVTDSQYRMALAVIRELGEAGFTVYAAAPEGICPPSFYSKHVKRAFSLPCRDEAQYFKALTDICRSLKEGDAASVLFPAGAYTLRILARNREIAYGAARLLIPDEATLKNANDKAYVAALAQSLGVPVPRSFGESLEEALENASFPAVIKYRDGEALGLPSPQRHRLVRDKGELISEYNRMSALQIKPLVQEYINGYGFGVSCVFDRDSRPVSVVCHRRVREYPVGGGPSACCESAWDDELASYAVKLLKGLSWQGVAMVEFRGQGKNFALMEINPRIWGSFPLTRAVKSGFAEAYCLAAAGDKLPVYDRPLYPLGKKMNFLIQDSLAAVSFVLKGDLKSGFSAVSDIINPFVKDGVLEWSDARASAAYVGAALSSGLKARGNTNGF